MHHLTKLLDLAIQINTDTNYNMAIRYNLDDTKSFGVDVLLNGAHLYHDVLDENANAVAVDLIIKQVRSIIKAATKWEVYFSDGTFSLNKTVSSREIATETKKQIDNRYGVNCKIREII